MPTYTLRELWVKACEHDGIDPESKFVVFTQDNPWMRKYNTLAGLILDAKESPAFESNDELPEGE